MKIVGPDEAKTKEDLEHERVERQRLAEHAHPFVKGLSTAAAIMGRDIGVLALRAINAQAGGLNAVLLFTPDRLPKAIAEQMTPEMIEGCVVAMVVPDGATVPGVMFEDTVRQASRGLVDGSQLVIFERIAVAPAPTDAELKDGVLG